MITTFRAGDYVALCDQCGRKKYASMLRKQWDGIYACGRCFDSRHPQELIPKHSSYSERLPFTRPDPLVHREEVDYSPQGDFSHTVGNQVLGK